MTNIIVVDLMNSALKRLSMLICLAVGASGCTLNGGPLRSSSSQVIHVTDPATTTPATFSDSSQWPTFSDAEDFYRIKYPKLGALEVTYSVLPLKTTLGWSGVVDFDVSIETLEPNGLRLNDWLKHNRGIDVSTADRATIQLLTVDGMNCVVVFSSTSGELSAFVEQDFFGEPALIHAITFTSYTHEDLYPPFWHPMLLTFESLLDQK